CEIDDLRGLLAAEGRDQSFTVLDLRFADRRRALQDVGAAGRAPDLADVLSRAVRDHRRLSTGEDAPRLASWRARAAPARQIAAPSPRTRREVPSSVIRPRRRRSAR